MRAEEAVAVLMRPTHRAGSREGRRRCVPIVRAANARIGVVFRSAYAMAPGRGRQALQPVQGGARNWRHVRGRLTAPGDPPTVVAEEAAHRSGCGEDDVMAEVVSWALHGPRLLMHLRWWTTMNSWAPAGNSRRTWGTANPSAVSLLGVTRGEAALQRLFPSVSGAWVAVEVSQRTDTRGRDRPKLLKRSPPALADDDL